MARPRKDVVDYFPHFVNWGKTIPILESRFGNDGYAVWFKILEILGKSEGHFYDCTAEVDWEFLVQKCRVSGVSATEILDLLARIGTIDRDLWEQDRVIWCDNFVAQIEDVYAKRKISAPEKPALRSFRTENPPSPEVSAPETRQRRVEESRGEERKNFSSGQEPDVQETVPVDEAEALPVLDPETPSEPKRRYTDLDMDRAVRFKAAIDLIEPEYYATKAKPPNLETWANEFRLIRTADCRQDPDVELMITDLPRAVWWSRNVRAPSALRGKTSDGREKFHAILDEIRHPTSPKQNGTSHGRTPHRGHDERTRQYEAQYVDHIRSITDPDARRREARALGFPELAEAGS